MHIAICDDEIIFATSIANTIKKYFAQYDLNYTSLTTYTNAFDLLKDYYTNNALDLIFLDIDMPHLSGIELAQKLRNSHCNAIIVFISSHPEFMASSFQVETFDFLTKPVSAEEIQRVLKRCLKKYQQRYGKISIKTSLGNSVIYSHKLLYATSNKHYVDFIFNDNTRLHSLMKLSQLEEQLAEHPQFARCHQSYLVNLDYISKVESKHLFFTHNYHPIIKTLPVSRTYSQHLKEKFLLYHF